MAMASPCKQALGISCPCLERVAERVSEVEQRALALLRLVPPDDAGLGFHARLDGVRQRPGFEREHGAIVLLQPSKEGRIAEQPVLGNLCVSGAQLAIRERAQRVGIGEHQARLVEGADKVLALRRIDASLAADGGIHLRQQRRRDLHEANTAAQDRRRKSGEVADDAAAQRHDEITALQAQLKQALAQGLQLVEALSRLARRQNDRADVTAVVLQSRFQGVEMKARDVRVRDDGAAGSPDPRGDQLTGARQQAGADQHVVRALAQRHVDGADVMQ